MTTELVQPTLPRKWYEIWSDIWRHPGVTSFQGLLNEPDHSPKRGYKWIAVTSLIAAILASLGSSGIFRSLQSDFGSIFIYYVCTVILSPIFGIIGLIISSGIYHVISRLFKGNGKWSDLVICSAVVLAPVELVGGVISLIILLFAQIPAAFIIPWLLSVAVSIYSIVLYVNALKTAENITTGQAVLTYFLPTIIVGLLALCLSLAIIPAFVTNR